MWSRMQGRARSLAGVGARRRAGAFGRRAPARRSGRTRTRPRSARPATSPTTRCSSPTRRRRATRSRCPRAGPAPTPGGAVVVHRQAQPRIEQPAPRRRRSTPASDARATSCPSSRASVRRLQLGTVRPSRAGRDAVLITYRAASAPDPVTGKWCRRRRALRASAKRPRGGPHAVGPKGADNVDPWRIVTDSLRWTAMSARRSRPHEPLPLLPRRRRRDARAARRLARARAAARWSPSTGPSGSGQVDAARVPCRARRARRRHGLLGGERMSRRPEAERARAARARTSGCCSSRPT